MAWMLRSSSCMSRARSSASSRNGNAASACPKRPQGIAPKNRHSIALGVGVDGRHVDLVELFARGRVFGTLVVRIRAHVMPGQDGRLISVLRDRLQPRDGRIDIRVVTGVHVHHRPNLQELHFRGAAFRERRRIDDFLGAFRIGPVEHLDSIGKRRGGRHGRCGSPSQERDQRPFSSKPHTRQHYHCIAASSLRHSAHGVPEVA